MKIEFISSSLAQLLTPALAVTGFEGSPASSGTAELLPPETRSLLEELKAGGELTGKALETTLLHRPPGLAAKKLLLVGAGKREKASRDLTRKLAGAVTRYLRARGLHELAWAVDGAGGAESIEAAVEGAILGDYDADRYRTEGNSERRIDRLVLATGGLAASAASLPSEAMRQA